MEAASSGRFGVCSAPRMWVSIVFLYFTSHAPAEQQSKVPPGNSSGCLGLDSYVTDAADNVVGCGLSFFDLLNFNRISWIVRAQYEMIAGYFHVLHGEGVSFEDGIHVGFVLAVGLERVVVAVNQYGSAGQQARVHTHAVPRIGAENDKTLPLFAVAFHFRMKLAQEALLELQHVFHFHTQNQRLDGNAAFDHQDVFEVVLTGRDNAGALVDL